MSEKEIEGILLKVTFTISVIPSVVTYFIGWIPVSKVLFFSWLCIWIILWSCLYTTKGGKN